MKKKTLIILLIILVLILVAVLLIRNRSTEEEQKILNIVSIWDGSRSKDPSGELDFSSSSMTVRKERDGFLRGIQDCPSDIIIDETLIPEEGNMADINNMLADVYNYVDTLLTVGASTEIVTMYSAMGSEFFNIPMLIPFSDGDVSISDSVGSTFRMTVSGDQLTDFVGNYIAPKDTVMNLSTFFFGDDPAQDIDIRTGIFFADDFNGHDTAVKVAQTLMDHGFDIEYYSSYDIGGVLPTLEAAWRKDEARLRDLDVVFIFGKDQDPFSDLMDVVNYWDDRTTFVLIGYVPEIDEPELYAAENIFMLEQDLDLSQCPADITTNGEALAYAAGYITKMVLSRAAAEQPPEKSGLQLWFKNVDEKHRIHQDYVDSFRNRVRTKLSELDEYIPCFGNLRLTSGSNESIKLELVRYVSQSQTEKADNFEVYNRIYQRLNQIYGTGTVNGAN